METKIVPGVAPGANTKIVPGKAPGADSQIVLPGQFMGPVRPHPQIVVPPPAQPAQATPAVLPDEAKQKLTGIINQMEANKESPEFISKVVKEFYNRNSTPAQPQPNPLEPVTLNNKIQDRYKALDETTIPKPGSSIWDSIKQAPRNFLRGMGAVAGMGNDIISTAAEKAIGAVPQPVKDAITEQPVLKAAKFGFEKSGAKQVVIDTVQVYNSWAEKHPEAAKDLSATGEIGQFISNFIGGEGAAKEVLPAVGKAATEGAANIEKNLAQKGLKEALDLTAPVLSKTEKEAALSSGRATTEGVLKKVVLKPTERDQAIAETVQGMISKNKSFTENINSVRQGIKDTAGEVKTYLATNDGPFVPQGLVDTLSELKTTSGKVFGNADKDYNAIVDAFAIHMNKQPKTMSGLWKARQAFDDQMESIVKNVWGESGDNARKIAVKDVRQAVNDYIAQSLPEGNPFKDSLRKMNLMYDAVDNIAAQNVQKVGQNVVQRFVSTFKQHPLLSTAAAAGIGAGAVSGVLTSPAALTALATYGTYKLGQKVFTSEMVQRALLDSLKTVSKHLDVESKDAVQGLLGYLSENSGLTTKMMNIPKIDKPTLDEMVQVIDYARQPFGKAKVNSQELELQAGRLADMLREKGVEPANSLSKLSDQFQDIVEYNRALETYNNSKANLSGFKSEVK